MSTVAYPQLRSANALQVGWHLQQSGIVARLDQRGDALYVTHDDDAAVAAALTTFVHDPDWRAPLPDVIRTHVGHLRDFRNGVRAGTFGSGMTAAQRRDATEHVIADAIDALRILVDERLDD